MVNAVEIEVDVLVGDDGEFVVTKNLQSWPSSNSVPFATRVFTQVAINETDNPVRIRVE